MPWIDTHCHFDASEFDADRDQLALSAVELGVSRIVIPGVEAANFDRVRALARRIPGGAYALGIHPLYTPRATEADLLGLRTQVEAALADPRFIGIGEIGLDYFVELDEARQQHFFVEQLRIARDFDLPAICHVRKSQDQVLKGLRRMGVNLGIAHAFNGSFQQAEAFIKQGFRLGFGGNLTFDRARQIRRLAQQLPLEAIVVETDAPDIAPSWLYRQRNDPTQLVGIGEALAALREQSAEHIALCTTANAHLALPRLHLSPA
jgi:TatD DNase family protein